MAINHQLVVINYILDRNDNSHRNWLSVLGGPVSLRHLYSFFLFLFLNQASMKNYRFLLSIKGNATFILSQLQCLIWLR